MAWGHAISTDMVHWTQQPHKILPFGNGCPFSGTGLVDHNNSLGKQVGKGTLVFMYSYALDDRPRFGALPPPKETNYHQAIAYSTDKGRTLRLLKRAPRRNRARAAETGQKESLINNMIASG